MIFQSANNTQAAALLGVNENDERRKLFFTFPTVPETAIALKAKTAMKLSAWFNMQAESTYPTFDFAFSFSYFG